MPIEVVNRPHTTFKKKRKKKSVHRKAVNCQLMLRVMKLDYPCFLEQQLTATCLTLIKFHGRIKQLAFGSQKGSTSTLADAKKLSSFARETDLLYIYYLN